MIKTPEEKDIFVRKNFGLVHSCANRFKGRFIEYDDLFSAGCIGLLKAIDGFDESRGLMFSTYAVPAILGEIKRLFRDGGAIKVSRSLKELSLKAVRARERFTATEFREPTVSELAEILDAPEEMVVEALNVTIPPISLTVHDDDGESQLDIPIDVIDDRIADNIALEGVIKTLEQQDRNLILLRYYNNKTQVQTAQILGMTQVQVSRREKKLLLKLRSKLA